MSYCAPNVKIEDHYTCFEYSELCEIAKSFNKFIEKNCNKVNNVKNSKCNFNTVPIQVFDIEVNDENENVKNRKRELWNDIYDRLKDVCKYEYCWIDYEFIKTIPDEELREKIKLFTFKPKMSMHIDNWLSTRDINNVLVQYEKLYDTFKFLGALPSDFYDVEKIDYSFIDSYTKIGIVFNLDGHKMNGSHWVAFLVDNKRRRLEYFDSVGNGPNKNIKKFIRKIKGMLESRGVKYKYYYNNIQHQYKNSECGIYAIYYIVQRLLGYSFREICKKVIDDDQMYKFRNNIFTMLM
jgi:hypothetical protein